MIVECTECGQEYNTTFGLHVCAQCSRRDCVAIRGQVAETQAKLKEWTARFERHLDEATKTITEMALEYVLPVDLYKQALAALDAGNGVESPPVSYHACLACGLTIQPGPCEHCGASAVLTVRKP